MRPFIYSFCFVYGISAVSTAYAQAPIITARIPAVNAVAAPRNSTVQLTFSQLMSAQAATPNAVRVLSAWRGPLLGSYSGGGSSTITFTPSRSFLPGEPIRVIATRSATSQSGIALAAASHYQFIASTTGGTGRSINVPDIPMAGITRSVAAGDVNSDGKQDLITANYSASGMVNIRLSDGRGGFVGNTDVSVGSRPISVLMRDVNSDGHLDILTANQSANTASVRLGNGQGSFTGSTEVAVGPSPIGIVSGDVNGDGRPDMLTANSTNGTVSIRLGNGQGGFAVPLAPTASEVTVGSNLSSIALGDVNGDSQLDLLASHNANNNTPGTVNIQLGNGRGGFTGTSSISVGQDPAEVVVGDVNQDGKLDLLVTNNNFAHRGTVSVRLGDGRGSFSSAPDVRVGGSPVGLVLGDINSDGRQDLLIINSNSSYNISTASVRLGDGLGGFAGFTDICLPRGARDITLGDVNGDGRLDLLTANSDVNAGSGSIGNSASVRLGDGQGRFAGFTELVVGIGGNGGSSGELTDAVVGDVNNDGNLDLLTANSLSSTASIRVGDGAGNFTTMPDVAVGRGPACITVGDVNGDGNLDLLTANGGSSIDYERTVSVRLGNGQGGFAGTTEIIVGRGPIQVVVSDVNGDGKLDLLTANFAAYSVSVRLGDGLGNFTGATEVYGNIDQPARIALGDVNGDGQVDLLIAEIYSNTVAVRLGNGQGDFTGITRVPIGNGSSSTQGSPISLALGDVNQDGNLDLVTANNRSSGNIGTVSVRLGNGQGRFAGTTEVAAGSRAQDVALGDVNGDGKLDLLVVAEDAIVVCLGNGLGDFSGAMQVSTGAFPRRLALGDIDNDGDLDMLAACYANSMVSLRLNGATGSGGPLAAAEPSQVHSGSYLLLFPNPAQHFVQVQGVGPNASASLFDMQGRLVRRFPTVSTPLTIAGLASGLYLLRCAGRTARLLVE